MSAATQMRQDQPRGERRPEPTLEEAFVLAFRHHPAGVAVMTADSGDGPVAITVSSLISVSRSPPMVAFSLSDASSSARALGRAESVVIHFIGPSDIALAQLCAASAADKFGGRFAWRRLASGEPCYEQVRLRFRAAIRDRLQLPGATLVTAELLESSLSEASDAYAAGEAVIYANRRWHRLSIGTLPEGWWLDDPVTF